MPDRVLGALVADAERLLAQVHVARGALAVDTDEQVMAAVDVLARNAPDAEDALAPVEQNERATDSAVDTKPASIVASA